MKMKRALPIKAVCSENQVFTKYEKPSLGRVAVSAFYGDRNGIKTNMYGQRNWHSASPPFGDAADRLIRIMAMLFPVPIRNRIHSISISKNCQFLFSCCGIKTRWVCFRSGQKNGHGGTVGLRADEGIGPYGKTTDVPRVGGDAHIAPLGAAPERSEKTDTPVPPATGMAYAIAMLMSKKT